MSTVKGTDAESLGVELKPCPFCGSDVYTYMEDHDNRSLEQIISCKSCLRSMSRYLAHGSTKPLNYTKRKELFENWNARVEIKDEDF